MFVLDWNLHVIWERLIVNGNVKKNGYREFDHKGTFNRVRVLGNGLHIPTQYFWEYPNPLVGQSWLQVTPIFMVDTNRLLYAHDTRRRSIRGKNKEASEHW